MVRDLHHEFHASLGMVDPAAVVPHAVGDNEPLHLEYGVVPRGLLEHRLCHRHAGRLAFHDGHGPSIGRCLLYTSDAADERSSVDLGGRRIIKKKTHHLQPVAALPSDRATISTTPLTD